jgi:hypothetical protein
VGTDQQGYPGKESAAAFQELWFQEAYEGQISVALLIIQPITHNKPVRNIKTSEGYWEVDNPLD